MNLSSADGGVFRVNWNHVYYFSLIVSSGSIKEASRILNLKPSTLSEHLSQLEKDLSVQLFKRANRRLTPTEEGRRLYQYAKQMFDMGQRLIDVISPLPLGSYPLAVGLVPSASFEMAYDRISAYLREFPKTSLRLVRMVHEDLERQLLEAKVDFGYTDQKSERKDIEQELLLSADFGFFAAPEVAKDYSLIQLLERLPLFITRAQSPNPSTIENILSEYEINYRSVVASEFPSFVVYMCRTGAGVAVISRKYVETMALPVKEIAPPANFPKISDKLYVTWAKSSRNSAAIQQLVALGPKTT